MYGISFKSGAVVLQQGALPKQDDCMYYLQQGEAEVVISGGADASKNHGEERKVDGHTVRIPQKPGWLFGDVALLFHSPRTASVVAKTNITVWAMDRRTFLKFVMKHAQGARALRFLRKLPLLKGLSDNDLIRAASRMPQRMYEDGQPLIRIGERGDELFLIRYGKVRTGDGTGRAECRGCKQRRSGGGGCDNVISPGCRGQENQRSAWMFVSGSLKGSNGEKHGGGLRDADRSCSLTIVGTNQAAYPTSQCW